MRRLTGDRHGSSPPIQVGLQQCSTLFDSLTNFVCRGYPIEQLAERSSHLESAYLLIYGALPTREQYQHWETEIFRHRVVHADTELFFRSFRFVDMHWTHYRSYRLINWSSYDAHPMSMLTSALAMLGSFYADANPSLQGKTVPSCQGNGRRN